MFRVRFTLAALLLAASGAVAPLAVSAQIPSALVPEMKDLPPLQTAEVFGRHIAYYEAGTGPTLVLVHGFASQARFDWGRVLGPLAQHHHVIALDQIGFGHSDKPVIDYRVQTFVDFLGEFLRVKGITRFDLAGESLGGWIVTNYTLQALSPENHGPYAVPVPRRLILEDAAGHKAISGRVTVAGSLEEAHGVAIVFHDKSLVTDAFARQTWEMKLEANDGLTEQMLTSNPKLAQETVQGKLQNLSIPTLVVWGEKDEIVPVADGHDYAEKIPHAQLVLVPECGHAPSIEKPQAFLDAVESFLR
ncbi:MAG: alpha/beta fold hydrolase [Acidobacteriaceae bacterium]|nr:alpha/beta fold hydrolase [Acidobacteriaceae bacterium]